MVYVYDNEIVTYLNFGVEKTIEQVRLDETNAAIEGLKNVQILSPLLQPECVEHLSRSVVQDQFVLLIGLFEHLFDTLVYGGRTDVYFVDAGNVNVPEQPDMHIRIKGLMAMLPLSGDEAMLKKLCRKMRALYDGLRREDADIEHLSMGMSGDWKLCAENGSNMIRLGTSLFGPRHYLAPDAQN